MSTERHLGDVPGRAFHGNQYTEDSEGDEVPNKGTDNAIPKGGHAPGDRVLVRGNMGRGKVGGEGKKGEITSSSGSFHVVKLPGGQSASYHESDLHNLDREGKSFKGEVFDRHGKSVKVTVPGKNRNAEARHLHLLGATGQARTEMWNGKEYLVVPVVALMEGVIHAVNAETPEFVPLATLQRAAASWNGKPVTLGHPKRDGRQCSADSADIRASHGLGLVRNARVEGKKMLCEAWVEQACAKRLDAQMLERLMAGKTEEVSVGAFVVTDGKASDFNGKPYFASWVEASGDHLAFLPGGRGACSVAMGCGTHRAAMHFVTAEAFIPEDELRLPTAVFSALEGASLDKRVAAVNDAVYKKWTPEDSQVMPSKVFDNSVIVRHGTKLLAMPYDIDADGKVTLGEATEVKQTYIAAAKYADCETCDGTGQVKDGSSQKDCPTCEGNGKLRTAAGARNSTADKKMIQAVHDHAMALGAECDRGNFKTAEKVSNIRSEGGRWVVFSSDGTRRLGAHATKAEAETQEQAITRSLERQRLRAAGDVAGHEFHGNQYSVRSESGHTVGSSHSKEDAHNQAKNYTRTTGKKASVVDHGKAKPKFDPNELTEDFEHHGRG